MEDFATGSGFYHSGTPRTVDVFPLPLGQYRIYVYGWAGQLPWLGTDPHHRSGFFEVFVSGASEYQNHFLNYSDVWPGQQVLGETYFTFDLNVTNANTGFSVRLQGQGSELLPIPTVCNGIQIVPVPAPGAVLLPLAAILAPRRRR